MNNRSTPIQKEAFYEDLGMYSYKLKCTNCGNTGSVMLKVSGFGGYNPEYKIKTLALDLNRALKDSKISLFAYSDEIELWCEACTQRARAAISSNPEQIDHILEAIIKALNEV